MFTVCELWGWLVGDPVGNSGDIYREFHVQILARFLHTDAHFQHVVNVYQFTHFSKIRGHCWHFQMRLNVMEALRGVRGNFGSSELPNRVGCLFGYS